MSGIIFAFRPVEVSIEGRHERGFGLKLLILGVFIGRLEIGEGSKGAPHMCLWEFPETFMGVAVRAQF